MRGLTPETLLCDALGPLGFGTFELVKSPSNRLPIDAELDGKLAFVLLGLAAWSGIWWLILPMALVTIACILACIPVGAGPAFPRSELDRIEERLREINGSLDNR